MAAPKKTPLRLRRRREAQTRVTGSQNYIKGLPRDEYVARCQRLAEDGKGRWRLETLEDLDHSGLDALDAQRMGIEDVDADWCEENLGVPRAGYRIPYPNWKGEFTDHGRVRHTEFSRKAKFGGKEYGLDEQKYSQPRGSGVALYIPPGPKWPSILSDVKTPVGVVEGEKKAAKACKEGILAVGIGGISSFKSGKRGIELLPELIELARGGRRLPVVFDSDIYKKGGEDMVAQRKRLAIELYLAGGCPELVDLPSRDNGEKVGLDDYLHAPVAHTAADFNALPRIEVDAKTIVGWLHKPKLLGYDKEELPRVVGRVVVEALKRGGTFLTTDAAPPELLYYDRQTATILSLEEGRGRELRAFVESRCGTNGADREWPQVHEQVANHCSLHGTRVKVHKLAYWDAKNRVHYLAQSDGRMFRTTREGRTLVANGTDGVFFRTNGRLAPIEPAASGTIEAFRRVSGGANFRSDDAMSAGAARLLWEVWQLAVLFPQLSMTRAIAFFWGVPGSRKTSGVRAFGRSLMGPGFQVSDIDKNKLDGMDAAIVANPFVGFDNVDGAVPGIENRLAMVATGGQLERRALYRTMQSVYFPADAFVAITSHNPTSLRRKDLVERELLLPCEQSEGFKPESEVIVEIDENRPEWWAHVLDLLVKIVDALGRRQPKQLEEMRLADFARFAQIVGPVLGYSKAEVRAALQALKAAKAEFVAEMSSIPDALLKVVDGRVSELYFAKLAGEKPKDGEKSEFDRMLADYSRPVGAEVLLAQVRQRVDSFAFDNARAFGVNLKQELAAINTRIDCVVTQDKHSKANAYRLQPKGGWLAAVAAMEKAAKAAREAESTGREGSK